MQASSYKEDAPVHVELVFRNTSEVQNLWQELQTWTPNGGWSALAQDFFEALKEAMNE